MSLQISVASFTGPVPDMDALLTACRRISATAVSVRDGGIAFDFQTGTPVEVCIDSGAGRISLSHGAAHAPALFLVLQHALASLGGTFRGTLRPLPPDLTPDGVVRYDAAERREFDRVSRRLLVVFASIVALFLALVAGIAYLGFRSLFGS